MPVGLADWLGGHKRNEHTMLEWLVESEYDQRVSLMYDDDVASLSEFLTRPAPDSK